MSPDIAVPLLPVRICCALDFVRCQPPSAKRIETTCSICLGYAGRYRGLGASRPVHPQPFADGAGNGFRMTAPIEATRNFLARAHPLDRARRWLKCGRELARPLVSAAREGDDMREILKRSDRAAHHWPASREVLMQLERINILRVVVHDVAQHADVEMLHVS